MLAMPTRKGFIISYWTGNVKTLKSGKQIKIYEDEYFTDENKFNKRHEELKKLEVEIKYATECIF